MNVWFRGRADHLATRPESQAGSATTSVQAIDLPRGQIVGETVDQGAACQKAQVAGGHRAVLGDESIGRGEARGAALNQGAAYRMRLRPVRGE